MYFLFVIGLILVLAWTNVISVHGAWLLGIPYFCVYYLAVLLVRYTCYARQRGHLEEAARSAYDRYIECSRQIEAIRDASSQKSLVERRSDVIDPDVPKMVGKVVGTLAQIFGHPVLGILAETAGEILRDYLSENAPGHSNSIDKRNSKLSESIMRLEIEKRRWWSEYHEHRMLINEKKRIM